MVDDMPVGGGGGSNPFSAEHENPPAQAAANADDNKPLEERLVSKAWAVRKTAFEELAVIMGKFELGTNNQVMNEHASKWAKYLADPNPGALEKVLECFGIFIDKCDPALLASVQNSIYAPIIDKGLGAAKPTLKAKSLECMLLYFEVSENFGEETLDALQAQVKSNKPKIALTAIQLLAALMLAFGIKKFNPARFGPQIVAAANSSAPANRAEAMNCYKAIFQWVGEEAVQPFIDPLKEAQKVQLKKDFEAIKAEKKEFKRKTRTEQELARQAAVDDAVNAAIEEEKKEEAIDVFDISAPQEILGQFGPDWATATLALKKWNEKADAMQAVITAADVPRLAPGDYSGLFEVVKKLAGDPHVSVCQQAIKAIGCLAKGLRKTFHDSALQAVPACFAKFKEKRLTEDIMKTLEHMITNCIQLGEIVENLKLVKTEKTPLTKLNIAVFIERAIRQTYVDDLEEIVDQLGPLAVSVSDEKDANLRDQGLIVLGVLLARVPTQAQKYVDPLIDAKKTKINAAKESVKLSKYDKSEKKAAAAAAAAKKKAAAEAKAAPKAASKATSKKPSAAKADVEMEDASAANDNVLVEVAPAKPRAPPAKKPAAAKKPATGGDEELEQPEAPKRGPPARLAAKAGGAAAAAGPTKTIKASDIQEEDLGSGLSKEQAIERVQGFYDAGHLAKFEEAKWQDKKEGFDGLKEQIEQLKPDTQMVEATAKFIKAKMKDWKESNLVMMKEAIQVLLLMTQHCEMVPKRAVAVYTPFLCDKIGDIKLNGPIKEALLNASEFTSAKFTSIQIVKKGLETKAPNNVKESCNFLAQLIEEFGAGRVAIKECIDFAVNSANHANKQVRDAAMAMLTVLYKHLGEKTIQFLDGVKPATMQLIEKEFEKITPYAKGEFQSTRQVKGEAAVTSGGGGGGAAAAEPDALAELENAMPRADISKQLNAKLIKQFTEADWKLKVKGCEAVQAILREAQMRIQPDGIGDLMEQLKVNQKASNKAVLKQVILLMGSMAEAVGQPISKYNKKCFLPLLSFLGDKAALMRADVVATANKWSEAIGPESVINNMCTYLTDGNPEMRNECLKWICENKAGIAKCEHPTMIKPLIMCLTDRSAPIRTMAEEVIVTTMGFVGFAAFSDGIKDLKPAVQGTVRPLLEKAKQKAITSNPDAAMQDAEEEAPPPQSGPTKKPVGKGGANAASKPTLKPGLASKAPASARGGGDDEQPKASPAKAAGPTRKVAPASKPTLKSSVQQPEEEPFSINPGNKERRAAVDSKSKWVPDDFKPAHVSAVKKNTEEIFGEEVSTLMWTTDFKKHLKVIDKLLTLIESQPQELMECIDVIFKWTTIKLTESQNTAFQNCVYDFFAKLFDFLISQQYLFWEHEAEVVLPLFADKVGNNNATLRQKVKQLIKQCFEMHDSKKTLLLLIKYGAMSKNLKSAGEALDEIAVHLRQIQSVPFGEQQIKIIAKLVDSKDSAVRENAICVLAEIYKQVDEDIWRVMGNVPLKVKGLLETRFKKTKGLGASSNNLNMSAARSNKRGASPRGSGATSKPNISTGQEVLTKSFNPGLKTQTPRVGLKFNAGQGIAAAADGQQPSGGQQALTRSFRPGTASQGNLARSFGARDGVRGFGANRPQTAVHQQESDSRATMPIPAATDGPFAPAQDSGLRHSEKLNFHPPQNNEMHFMDDDEDLRQLEKEIGTTQQQPVQPKVILDPETQRQVDDIMKYISNLKYSSDLNKRVESLIALNEIIQAIQTHEKSIQHTANDLISAFTHVLIDIFERPRQDTPLRFAKYFVTIVNKTCQCPIIMSVVREQELYELGEQLLTRLLIDNLDKLGDEKEGEFILKNLNGSMLRCLENCNKTSIFCVLFNLLRRYKDNPAQVKLPGLIIKCLLKLSKILERVISELEIERVLLVIHLYLISINHEAKTSNDDMGIRIVKTLVHEMVKIKQHSILQSYRVVENHEVEDKHLHRWIRIILNTIDPNAAGNTSAVNQSVDSSNAGGQPADREINQIIQELKSTDMFQNAIPKLHNFLARNPHLSLDYYIRDLSAHFQEMIKSNLTNYRNQHCKYSQGLQKSLLAADKRGIFAVEAIVSCFTDSGSTPNGTSSIKAMGLNPQDRPSTSSTSLAAANQSSEQKRFGFAQRQSMTQENFSTVSKLGASQQKQAAPGTGADSTTSTDRINQYQSKLSSMREKFQQRKTLAPAAEIGQKGAAGTPSQNQAKSTNMNASFSAMNSSLQQRWKAAQSKQTGATRESTGAAADGAQQFANTMVAGGTTSSNRFQTEVARPNAANALSSSNSNAAAGGAEAGASNQDLTKRLAELKGKLAALKKN